MVKRKSKECTRLEQEVVNMRSDLEKARIHEGKFKMSTTKLDEIIANRKGSKDKEGLVFEIGESLNLDQMLNTERKIEDKKNNCKIKNRRNDARRPPSRQPNVQSYPSFNCFCYSCNKFGPKAMKCRSKMNASYFFVNFLYVKGLVIEQVNEKVK